MADPVTWMAVISAASASVAAVGAIKQGQAASAANKFNAKIAEQNAEAAEQQGEAAADAQRRDAQRRIGAMEADIGASGGSMGGSATDVLADSIRMATLDNLTTKYNYQMRGAGYQNEASLNKSAAKSARTASYFEAGDSLLRGAGNTLSYYG